MSDQVDQDKSRLATFLIAVFHDWGVSNAEMVTLLALPDGTKPRAIHQYQQGTPFPEDESIQARVDHFVGIAEALRLAYPLNMQGGKLWLHRPNRHFERRTPLSVMIEDGLSGIAAVRMRIDCSYDWHVDELNHQK
ncbi:antitoxin Xre/MbcA/ParS toxin-binding domain-containing protein [Kaarinaea lacus]